MNALHFSAQFHYFIKSKHCQFFVAQNLEMEETKGNFVKLQISQLLVTHFAQAVSLFAKSTNLYNFIGFWQSTNYGGVLTQDESNIENMKPVKDRVIKIRFNADISSSMMWNFKPQQREIHVIPGETALAFYTATNPTDVPVTGVSTYNVVPFEAGQYFNKIQCFCFEEQRLDAGEQVRRTQKVKYAAKNTRDAYYAIFMILGFLIMT